MTKIELLSPARNASTAKEAILHGADAVYIGAPRFGARSAAGNSLDDIRELVPFAHMYGVKVYVTLNTILYDNELNDAKELVEALYEIGVDALIVQDLSFLKMELPPIPLHASTQMDNRSAQKVQWLYDQGFRQAVLARELTIDEISEIHSAVPGMQLEVFVHGATCVSYNGLCYASQYCFNRSANRGECAQFCRMPFDLIDSEGKVYAGVQQKHLLSLHDMNRSEDLEALLDAGVVSLKIEGRLKDEAYVKNVTAYYRKKLDEIFRRRSSEYQRSSVGVSNVSFNPQLDRSFNRGFSNYFLYGRTPDMVQLCSPKSLGQHVGHVKEVRRNCFTVSGTVPFANGDGLCFIDDTGNLHGFRVNRVEGNCLYPKDMPDGLHSRQQLYRNNDQAFNQLLSHSTAQRHIPVFITVSETSQESVSVTFKCVDGIAVTQEFRQELCPARSPQCENIKRQMSRLGETVYEALDVRVDFTEEWFIPSSILSEWRRNMVGLLDAERLRRYNQIYGTECGCGVRLHKNSCQTGLYQGCNLSYKANVSNKLAKAFYEQQGANSIEPALEIQETVRRDNLQLMTLKYCPRYELGLCSKFVKKAVPALSLRSSDGRVFPLHFDCKKCLVHVLSSVSKILVLVCMLSLASCFSSHEEDAFADERQDTLYVNLDDTSLVDNSEKDSLLVIASSSPKDSFALTHHYSIGYNFDVEIDSLSLCTEIPSRAQQLSVMPDSLSVYYGDILVVAEVQVVPEDSIDSVWVKVARDQSTQGWLRESDLLASVAPDDPISQAIYYFSGNHVFATLLLVIVVLFFLTTRFIKARAGSPKDGTSSKISLLSVKHYSPSQRLTAVSSPYPIILCLTMGGAAVFYASMQLFVPDVWEEFYFHPTLNPFAEPALLGAFLVCVWLLLLFFIATVDDALRQLNLWQAFLYMLTMSTNLLLLYIFFSQATLLYIGYPLFLVYVYRVVKFYFERVNPKYHCGNCGKPLQKKGVCPHCGVLNK